MATEGMTQTVFFIPRVDQEPREKRELAHNKTRPPVRVRPSVRPSLVGPSLVKRRAKNGPEPREGGEQHHDDDDEYSNGGCGGIP